LWKNGSEWPKAQNPGTIPLSSDDLEVKKTVSLAKSANEERSPVNILDYFSDWHRVERAITFCLRYIHPLASKSGVSSKWGNQDE